MKYTAKPTKVDSYETLEEMIDWIIENCQYSVYMRSYNSYLSTSSWNKIKVVKQYGERGLHMMVQDIKFGSKKDHLLFTLRWC